MALRLGKTASIALVCALCLGSACTELSARRKIQDGNKHFKEDKPAEAIASYEEALKLGPGKDAQGIAHFNLAVSHISLFKGGDKSPANETHASGAIDNLNKYLETSPGDETARKLLIGMYTKSGRFDGALAYFQGEFDKNPKDPFNAAQLADINKQAKRWSEARKWWMLLSELETDPTARGNALQMAGSSYWTQLREGAELTGEEKVKLADEGIALLLKAVEMRPEDPGSFTYLGLVYRQRGAAQGKSYVAAADVATAAIYQKKAQALKNTAPPAPAPGAPAKPGDKSAPATPAPSSPKKP
jgi:tetratricopeptide (TPR) repeat protein